MAVVGGFGGLFMCLYVVMSCFFQRITELNPVTGDVIPSTSHGYGLIARELATNLGETPDMASYQSCILYPRDEYEYIADFHMKTARNLAFLGGTLGLMGWTVFIGAYCFQFSPPTMERWIMWTYIWAAICMAFTMLMWGGNFCQENKCQVAPGTGYAISSFFTFLMLANQAKSMGQPPATSRNRDEDGMPEPGSREDDYWYDDENERYMVDDVGSESEEDDEDASNFDVFEDEVGDDGKPRKRRVGFQEPEKEGRFQNGGRPVPANDATYDEVSEYLAPEDRYVPQRDQQFLEYDQERYHQQAANYEQHQPQYAGQGHPVDPHWRQGGANQHPNLNEQQYFDNNDNNNISNNNDQYYNNETSSRALI